ncbi:MAG: MFS transporter [Bacteroidales bacterium]|jgi:MFS family permease|nr:MFS transporter [Bacteroidales bacterium]
MNFIKDKQYYKFCLYGFLKNLRFFEPFLILFFLEKGINFFHIGILYSIREIGRNILELPSGIIADAFGRKKAMIFAFSTYLLSFVIFTLTSKFFFFAIAMIFYSMGDAFRTGTHKAMIFEYLKIKGWKNQKVHYYGRTRSASQIGSAVSSLLAALLILYTGKYSLVFIFSTIPYILDLILMISYPNVLNGKTSAISFTEIKSNFKTITSDFLISFKQKKNIKDFGNLSVHSSIFRTTKDYLQVIIYSFTLSIPFLPNINNNKKSAIFIGLIYFIIFMLTSWISRKSGVFADKMKSIEKPLNLTLIIGFILLFLSGIFYHYQFFIFSIILFLGIHLIENLRNPIGVAYLSDMYSENILATALSANSQAKSIMAAIFAPIIGLLADYFDIGIALSIVSLFLIILYPILQVNKTNKNNIGPSPKSR